MASIRNLYDVVIIGGGPVGSQVAFRMVSMGYRTAVLEKKPDLAVTVCCTGLVSNECIDHFDIPDSVVHRTAKSARLFSPSGQLLSVKRKQPQVTVLNRPAFNHAWAKRAEAKGAEYLFSTDARNITMAKKSATVDALSSGERISLQARVVVLTTGFGSQMMDRLGLGAASDFVMGAQAELTTNEIDEVEIYTGSKIAPGFFAWLVPTAKDKALVGLLSRRYPPAYLRSLLTRLAAEGKIKSTSVTITYGGVPLRPLHKTYADRLLVVGTAAGQVKPITGGGIYFGLLCADIAANTLNRALLQDDLTADRLAGYQRGWKRKLGRELRVGYWARRFYEMLNDQQIDRVFELMETSGIIDDIQSSEELSFDWHADIISHIFRQRLFLRAFRSMKLPFRFKERLQKNVGTYD